MMIPPKAIISCPTENDAAVLFAFLGSEGYTYGGYKADRAVTQWHSYESETCYSLHTGKVICRTSRQLYEQYCREYDSDCMMSFDYRRNSQFVPDNFELRFIHAVDFIKLCGGSEVARIDNEILLSLL